MGESENVQTRARTVDNQRVAVTMRSAHLSRSGFCPIQEAACSPSGASWRQSNSRPPHASNTQRAILRVEQMEDRAVPSVVYSNTFDLNGVATVTETVTDDDPSHPGQYHWNFHLTNVSFASGIGTFALPAE